MSNKYKIKVVKDDADNYTKKYDLIPDLSCRGLIFAKSGSGKTNLICNMMLLWYKGEFQPEDIYIFSPSISNDTKLKKMIKFLEIPQENLFKSYNPEEVEAVYDNIEEVYESAINDGESPPKSIIIFDDLGFSNDMKKTDIIAKIYMNARHINCSCFSTFQQPTQCGTGLRENANAVFIYPMSSKRLSMLEEEYNYTTLSKKDFMKVFRQYTPKPYNFICINFTNEPKERYLDSDMKPIPELCNAME